jgi:hypothetical protein
VGEALWRTGWNLDRAAFMAQVEREHPDALVMTSKGVRVDLLHLLVGSAQTGAVVLPTLAVVGPVQFDTLR